MTEPRQKKTYPQGLRLGKAQTVYSVVEANIANNEKEVYTIEASKNKTPAEQTAWMHRQIYTFVVCTGQLPRDKDILTYVMEYIFLCFIAGCLRHISF